MLRTSAELAAWMLYKHTAEDGLFTVFVNVNFIRQKIHIFLIHCGIKMLFVIWWHAGCCFPPTSSSQFNGRAGAANPGRRWPWWLSVPFTFVLLEQLQEIAVQKGSSSYFACRPGSVPVWGLLSVLVCTARVTSQVLKQAVLQEKSQTPCVIFGVSRTRNTGSQIW